MHEPRLFLDTSVWREAAIDRTWLREMVSQGKRLAATDEVVQELAVAALAVSDPAEYEEIRKACRLVARYSFETVPPFEYVLANELGLGGFAEPDPRLIAAFIAEHETQESLRSRRREEIDAGPGHTVTLDRWLRIVARQKATWVASFRDALEQNAPGLVDARARGERPYVTADRASQLRATLMDDTRALAQVEVVQMERLFEGELPLDWAREAGIDATLAATDTYVRTLSEALLDRLDHPGNASRKKVKLEGNDAYDVAQLRYLRPGDLWATEDTRWLTVAESAGTRAHIVHPSEVCSK